MEHGLSLATVSRLLAIITSLSLDRERVLSLFVLGHFMWCVLSAGFALAICSSCLWDVDHIGFSVSKLKQLSDVRLELHAAIYQKIGQERSVVGGMPNRSKQA